MGLTESEWISLAKRRIGNILEKHRISYSRHLEIKISEAGPNYMRVEPVLVNKALSQLIKSKAVMVVNESPKIIGAPDFGKPGDKSRLAAFLGWRDLFVKKSNDDPICGMVLEHLISETVSDSDKYWVVGGGPKYNDEGKLYKPKGSEVLFFENREIFKAEHGAGFDLFAIDKENQIPIGIEAKNIREWLYPASQEVWRAIARACTLECLPVIAARKISYITTAGMFSRFGIMGFETQFQYFHNDVQKESKYQFKDKVINKDRLGFADIKLVKQKDKPPKHFNHFFENILPNYSQEYFDRFMENRDLLMTYAIDYGLADSKLNGKERFELYKEFQEEAEFADPDFEEPEIEAEI